MAIRNCIASAERDRHHEASNGRVARDARGLCGGDIERAGCPADPRRVPVDETFIDESCVFRFQPHLTASVPPIGWVDEDRTTRRFEAFPQGRATHTNLST